MWGFDTKIGYKRWTRVWDEMVLVKMLMEIDPVPMRGSLVMTMVMISPSRRDVSPTEQLRRSPRLVSPGSASRRQRFVPKASSLFFLKWKTSYSRRWAPKACQGAHEVGGHAQGVGRAPYPCGQGVGPLWYFLRSVIIINSNITFVEFQDFWSCAE